VLWCVLFRSSVSFGLSWGSKGLGVFMCFFLSFLFFFLFLVRDHFILAFAIGGLLYLCKHWAVQHKKKKKEAKGRAAFILPIVLV